MPKVLISGSTGFLGWHLCEGFRDAGWEVVGIVRPGNSKALPQGVSRVEARLDARDLATVLVGSPLVVHAAGIARARSEDIFQAVNVQGTKQVVEAAGASGSELVFISSQAAAGPGTSAQPAREDDPPQPLTAYGRSKLAAEAVVRASAAGWIILRPSAIYGPRDRQFLTLFRMAARGRFALAGTPSASYTLVHVDDVVRATVAAATDRRARGQTLFVGHPQSVSAETLLETIASAVGRPFRPLHVPRIAMRFLATAGELSWKLGCRPLVDDARYAELYADGWVCAVDKMRDVLEVTASTDLTEGLATTAGWYKELGWL